MAKFKPIKQVRVSAEVLGQLKGAILRGQFTAGDKLPSERELTEQFRVSRGVVREAIRTLEVTGFVTIRQGPTGGAYVTELTFDRLSGGFLDLFVSNKLTMPEVNQVRKHIEPEIARLAASRVNDEYRWRLGEALKKEGSGQFGSFRYMENMTAVHHILAEMCGNYLFEAIINSIIKLTHEIVAAVEPVDHEALHALHAHDEVVEAVLRGESEKAARAMADHLEGFCEALMKMDHEFRIKGRM